MLIRRPSSTGSNSLHTIYRPRKVSEILGNSTNKRILNGWLDNNNLSKCLLFTGHPGCGKTTTALLLAMSLNCEVNGVSSEPCMNCSSCKSIIDENNIDLHFINVGRTGGKDAVDNVIKDLATAPMFYRYKIILFDESHKLTSAAQDLLLTITERGYNHVYFMFVTNKPEKLSDELIQRCSVMHFDKVSKELIVGMLKNVAEFEGMPFNDAVIEYIADKAEGVPRVALVDLDKINAEGSWTLEVAKEIIGIMLDEGSKEVIDLCRAMIDGKWKESKDLLNKINIEANNVRIAVYGYFTSCLKRTNSFSDGDKYSKVLDILNDPIYETGKFGKNKFINQIFKIISISSTIKKKWSYTSKK